jgi:hypothetical protein
VGCGGKSSRQGHGPHRSGCAGPLARGAECRACANKPGSPALCPACLHNRALVGLLQQRLAVAEARATANALERDYWLAFYDERGPKKQRVYRFKEAFKAMANARGKVGEEERKLAALTKARET